MTGSIRLDFEHSHKVTEVNTNLGITYRPTLPVRLSYNEAKVDLDVILDSGADISMFQLDVAKILGIPNDLLIANPFELATGQVNGWLFPIDITICERTYSCRCAFIDNSKWLNVLGRETIFEKMKFAFRQGVRQFYFSSSP